MRGNCAGRNALVGLAFLLGSALAQAGLQPPELQSAAVVVQESASGRVVLAKSAKTARPIASITKLMTAMIVLDAKLPMTERVAIQEADRDHLRGSRSRLAVGTRLSRRDLLQLALMSSENRAAHALSRAYPGGTPAFVAAMNAKARKLGLASARFADPTGLSSANVASARDLAQLVVAAAKYPRIRQFSTTATHAYTVRGRKVTFANTNSLIRGRAAGWQIGLSKTGFIHEAGRCLVMATRIKNKPAVIVLLDSPDTAGRTRDAQAIKRWLEQKRRA